jgi:hypothetical protein
MNGRPGDRSLPPLRDRVFRGCIKRMDHAPVAITSVAGFQHVPRRGGRVLLQEAGALFATVVVMVVTVQMVVIVVLMVRLQADAVERATHVHVCAV